MQSTITRTSRRRRSPAVLALSLLSLAAIIFALRRGLRELRRFKRRLAFHGRQWFETRWMVARAALAHRVEQQVEVALNSCAEHARGVLKDPAMPLALQRAVDHIMDGLLPDIKHESFRVLDEHLQFLPAARNVVAAPPRRTSFSPLSPRHSTSPDDARHSSRSDMAESSGSPLRSRSRLIEGGQQPAAARDRALARRSGGHVDDEHLQWLLPPWLLQLMRRERARILHVLWPHDRSLWISLRSARWWALHLLGVLPWVGTWWWLILAFAVDKQDEYQLCQFIVALRCTHFVTLGVGAALSGCFAAYQCAAFAAEPDSCASRLPTLSPFAAVFWAVQLAITSRAFFLLPQSQKKGQRVFERRSRLSIEHRRALAAGQAPPPDAAGMAEVAERGGVLVKLGWLDLALAALAILAVALAAIVFREDFHRLQITLYHIRTAHGLLSCPYVVLRMPGAMSLLTHSRRTGYDQLGHCVPYVGGTHAPPAATAASPRQLRRTPAAPAEFSPQQHQPLVARRLLFHADSVAMDSASGRVLRALTRQFGG